MNVRCGVWFMHVILAHPEEEIRRIGIHDKSCKKLRRPLFN
jgi:hypothetical protein